MLKGWKILIFGAITTVLGGLQAADIAQVVPPQHVGTALSIIGAITMVLRYFSNTAVGSSVEAPKK